MSPGKTEISREEEGDRVRRRGSSRTSTGSSPGCLYHRRPFDPLSRSRATAGTPCPSDCRGTGESGRALFPREELLRGSVGTIYAKEVMTLALAYGLKLDKFGA